MQEQKRRLERLAEGKAAVERKLDSADADLKRREEKSREEQQSVLTLRQSLHQLSDREREVRAGERGSCFGQTGRIKNVYLHFLAKYADVSSDFEGTKQA